MSEMIKEKVKERYGKIALTGNSDYCGMPEECSTNDLSVDAAKITGHDTKNWRQSHNQQSWAWVCGAPIKFADLKEGETVTDHDLHGRRESKWQKNFQSCHQGNKVIA